MNEPFHEPLTVWRFIRRYSVRIMIGMVLVVAVSIAVFVWVPYQREQWIAHKILDYGGEADFEYCGPAWVPKSIQEKLLPLRRINSVMLHRINTDFHGNRIGEVKIKAVPVDLLNEISLLSHLKSLYLQYTDVTDDGLKRLVGLAKVRLLNLEHTNITDRGMTYLPSMQSLEWLVLDNTTITDDGLKQLKTLKTLTHLFAIRTDTSDVGVEELKGLSSLEWIDLIGTSVSEEGETSLKKALPNCRIRLRSDLEIRRRRHASTKLKHAEEGVLNSGQ